MKNTVSIFIMVFCTIVYAKPYTPSSDDEILISWDVEENDVLFLNANLKENPESFYPNKTSEIQVIKQAEKLINQSNIIGKSHYYELANSVLQPFMHESKNPKLWLLRARIQQNKHEFYLAIESVKKVLEINKNDTNANLLISRLYIITQQFEHAKSACLNLIGSASIITSRICLLEVLSYKGQLSNSYQQLSRIMKDNLIDENHQSWVVMILSEMAVRQGYYEKAEIWLDQYPQNINITYLNYWADIKLLLKKPIEVFDKLSTVAELNTNIEDSILLRLAIAEKLYTNNENQTQWEKQIQQRIKLRELRNDIHHADEMALYYLEIDFNPERALYWAKINFDKAKESKDLNLVNKAQKAVESSTI